MRMLRVLAAAIGLTLSVATVAQSPADEGWPASERILGKFRDGKYAEVIAEAPQALRAEPWHSELRLAYATSLLWNGSEAQAAREYAALVDTDVGVEARLGLANALAWSGNTPAALPQYRRLLGSAKSDEAKLGLANALRLSGREDLALPLYRELRAAHPNDDIGKEGLFYAERSVRGRTAFGASFTKDSTPTQRFEPVVSHEWRDPSRAWIFGVEASGGRDWRYPAKLTREEYALRIEALGLPLAPRVSVSQQVEPRSHTFGELRLRAGDWPMYVSAGHINWGKLSFTLQALEQGLTADRVGVEGAFPTALGEVRGYANHYRISDDNRIDNGDARLTLRWRPLGAQVKPFVGVDWRYSRRADPDYWSPRRFVLGYGGVEAAWSERHWTFGALAQVGFKIAGDASTSLAGFLSAKRWLRGQAPRGQDPPSDWAIGITAFTQTGTREATYRARGATLTLEKLW
jgi:tetratricopeptide (TPR) repeat protein